MDSEDGEQDGEQDGDDEKLPWMDWDDEEEINQREDRQEIDKRGECPLRHGGDIFKISNKHKMSENRKETEKNDKEMYEIILKITMVLGIVMFFYPIVKSPYFGGKKMIVEQLKFPIDFYEIRPRSTDDLERSKYQLCSTFWHVYLRVDIPPGYFTIGVTTIPECDGVFLSVPDLKSWQFQFIPSIKSKIDGELNAKQADYLKKCMMEKSNCFPNGYEYNGNRFHLHRLKNSNDEYCNYRMFTPTNPTSGDLETDVNCGTWLTHFILLGESSEQDDFVEWYKRHAKYMTPGWV